MMILFCSCFWTMLLSFCLGVGILSNLESRGPSLQAESALAWYDTRELPVVIKPVKTGALLHLYNFEKKKGSNHVTNS